MTELREMKNNAVVSKLCTVYVKMTVGRENPPCFLLTTWECSGVSSSHLVGGSHNVLMTKGRVQHTYFRTMECFIRGWGEFRSIFFC